MTNSLQVPVQICSLTIKRLRALLSLTKNDQRQHMHHLMGGKPKKDKMVSNLDSLNSHQSFDGVTLVESTLAGWEKKIHGTAEDIVIKLKDTKNPTTIEQITASFSLQSLGVRANSMVDLVPSELANDRYEIVQDLLIIGIFHLIIFTFQYDLIILHITYL